MNVLVVHDVENQRSPGEIVGRQRGERFIRIERYAKDLCHARTRKNLLNVAASGCAEGPLMSDLGRRKSDIVPSKEFLGMENNYVLFLLQNPDEQRSRSMTIGELCVSDDERRVLQFGGCNLFARGFPAAKQLFHESNHRLETKRLEPTVQTTPKKQLNRMQQSKRRILF